MAKLSAYKPKPCPFCGRCMSFADALKHAGQSEEGHFIWCEGCGALGPDWQLKPDRGARTPKEAILAWNQRAEVRSG